MSCQQVEHFYRQAICRRNAAFSGGFFHWRSLHATAGVRNRKRLFTNEQLMSWQWEAHQLAEMYRRMQP